LLAGKPSNIGRFLSLNIGVHMLRATANVSSNAQSQGLCVSPLDQGSWIALLACNSSNIARLLGLNIAIDKLHATAEVSSFAHFLGLCVSPRLPAIVD
jgi:hypothetical protein